MIAIASFAPLCVGSNDVASVAPGFVGWLFEVVSPVSVITPDGPDVTPNASSRLEPPMNVG